VKSSVSTLYVLSSNVPQCSPQEAGGNGLLTVITDSREEAFEGEELWYLVKI